MQSSLCKKSNRGITVLDVKNGDHIRVLDKSIVEFENNGPRSLIVVSIIRRGKVIAQKNFELDERNLEAIAAAHGHDWLNREMRITIVKQLGPNGELLDRIALSLPIIELSADPNPASARLISRQTPPQN